MTPERWEVVSDLFDAALRREPHERSAFLTRTCGDDGELRAEVESLIHEHEASGEFPACPPIGAAALLRDAWRRASESSGADPHLGTTVANRYRIDARLGRGGQALVYRASDLMLMSKPVVVKILATSAQGSWLTSRLPHEIEALARIDHPGVVGVLDTGTLPDGSPFLVMQYVEGTTLRQALDRGTLERSRAAAIVRQIGAALEAAHGKGIVHGDLKPENIVLQRLSDGSELAKLIDFGLARVEFAEAASRSSTGPIAGSVRYMAPEQFEGTTSRASDIYVLGLLACEMLCGQPDIRGLRARRRVTRLIRTALALRPQDRPASAKVWCARLADALLHPWRRHLELVAAGMAAAALLIAWSPWNRIPAAPGDVPIEIRTLAILPFQVLGQAADADALELGVADDLITRLSSISGLTVRPIATVRKYHGTPVDPARAAKELQVDAILEGTLQASGGSGLRANLRLIRAGDGRAQWAGTIESDRQHVVALEESIAAQIALNAHLPLTDRERRNLEARRQVNPEAHELYVRGRFEWGKRTGEGFERAADYFRRAIDLDPTYARAYAGLADCYLLLGGYSFSPQLEAVPKAKALALRALELDPSLGEAHATLGLSAQNLEWDWSGVEDHYRQAIALAPNYATGHHWYAEFLSILGRFDESRHAFAQARRIDPISPIIQVDEAQLYWFERQYDRSREILERVERTDPNFDLVHNRIALIHMMEGRHEEAWQRIQRIESCREPAGDCYRSWTAYLPGRNAAAARAALLGLEREAGRRRIPPFMLILANARQGRLGRALDWLEYMLEKHEVSLITIAVNPLFDPLRAEPRFAKVLGTLKLPLLPAPPPSTRPLP
jgi:serine/threonine-protein kinase